MLNNLFSTDFLRRRLLKTAPAGPLKKFLESPVVDHKSNLEEIEFLAIDLETSGLNPLSDEILSVGYTVIRNMNVVLSECQHFLVKPERGIPEETAVIHGILDDASAGGIEPARACTRVLEALRGRVLLAHNADIECKFISSNCRKLFGGNIIFPVVDTYAIERASLQRRDISSKAGDMRLDKLRDRYGLPRYPAHNALSDALAAAELFLAQIAHRQGRRKMKLKELSSRCYTR